MGNIKLEHTKWCSRAEAVLYALPVGLHDNVLYMRACMASSELYELLIVECIRGKLVNCPLKLDNDFMSL